MVAALLWFRERGPTPWCEAGLGEGWIPAMSSGGPGHLYTSVAREHAGILGETLAEIAAEKARIVKPKP